MGGKSRGKERAVKFISVILICVSYLFLTSFLTATLALSFANMQLFFYSRLLFWIFGAIGLLSFVFIAAICLLDIKGFSFSPSFQMDLKISLLPFYLIYWSLCLFPFFLLTCNVFALIGIIPLYIGFIGSVFVVLFGTSAPVIVVLIRGIMAKEGKTMYVSVVYLLLSLVFLGDVAAAILIYREAKSKEGLAIG